MKKAILAVSFGTTYENALDSSIGSLEKDICINFPDYRVFRAFTSNIVMKKLSTKGIHINNVSQALDQLFNDGYDEVIIQPTHIISGIEYDKICDISGQYISKFSTVKTGTPLFSSENDMKAVCSFFAEKFPSDKAVLFMGHGTEHSANELYTKFSSICSDMNFSNMFTATVEGNPEISDVIPELKRSGYTEVIITPLMLVAGDHAQNDMNGDGPDSWRNILTEEGFNVIPLVKGLGEYQEIRNIYISHLKDLISSGLTLK